MRSVPLSTLGDFTMVLNPGMVVPILTPEEYTEFSIWLNQRLEVDKAAKILADSFMAPYESLDSKGRPK